MCKLSTIAKFSSCNFCNQQFLLYLRSKSPPDPQWTPPKIWDPSLHCYDTSELRDTVVTLPQVQQVCVDNC